MAAAIDLFVVLVVLVIEIGPQRQRRAADKAFETAFVEKSKVLQRPDFVHLINCAVASQTAAFVVVDLRAKHCHSVTFHKAPLRHISTGRSFWKNKVNCCELSLITRAVWEKQEMQGSAFPLWLLSAFSHVIFSEKPVHSENWRARAESLNFSIPLTLYSSKVAHRRVFFGIID